MIFVLLWGWSLGRFRSGEGTCWGLEGEIVRKLYEYLLGVPLG